MENVIDTIDSALDIFFGLEESINATLIDWVPGQEISVTGCEAED
ncbi:MAG: hypothetical protein AAFO91_18350 [Bacteroidota bacterium]